MCVAAAVPFATVLFPLQQTSATYALYLLSEDANAYFVSFQIDCQVETRRSCLILPKLSGYMQLTFRVTMRSWMPLDSSTSSRFL